MHFYFLFYRDFHGFQARYNFYKHFSEEYKQILQLSKCKIFFISNVFRIKVSLLIITTIFSGIGICFSAKCQHKIQGSAFRLSRRPPYPVPMVRPMLKIFRLMQLRQCTGVSLTQIFPG